MAEESSVYQVLHFNSNVLEVLQTSDGIDESVKSFIVELINKKMKRYGSGPFTLTYQQVKNISSVLQYELNMHTDTEEGGRWSCLMTN